MFPEFGRQTLSIKQLDKASITFVYPWIRRSFTFHTLFVFNCVEVVLLQNLNFFRFSVSV